MTKPSKLKNFFLRICQSLYITTNLFFQNSLVHISAACAFGLLFSILPVIFLIIIVLIRVLHTEQSLLMQFYPYLSMLMQEEQYENLIQSALSVKKVGTFEIITVIAIFWLARRFFLYIMRGFKIIFHTETKRKPSVFVLAGFLAEVAAVVGIAVILAAVFTVRSVLKISFISEHIPILNRAFIPIAVTVMPQLLLYLVIFLSYRFAPGTKPKTSLAAVSALWTTLIYRIMQMIFRLFLNTSRYNLIYGVLSNVMVLLLEAGTFFQIYLFFAEYIYVKQFYHLHYLAELYLLPTEPELGFLLKLKRKLFLPGIYSEPAPIYTQKIFQKADSIIYDRTSAVECVYYVIDGIIEIQEDGVCRHIGKGSFFGEVSCMSGKTALENVRAVSDVTLMCIKKTMFEELLEKNHDVNMKVLSLVSKAVR